VVTTAETTKHQILTRKTLATAFLEQLLLVLAELLSIA